VEIYIHKSKKNHGPYSLADLQGYLDKGIFSETDYCCYDGKNWVRLNAVPGIKLIDEDQMVEEESEQETDTDADNLSSSKSRIIAKLIPIFLLGFLAGFWLFITLPPVSSISPNLFQFGYNIISLAVLIYLPLKVLRFFKGEGISECNSSFFQTKLIFYSGLLVCSMIVMLSPSRYQGLGFSINNETIIIEILTRIFPAFLFIYSIVKLYFLRGEVLDENPCISDGLQKSKKDSKSESSKENGLNLKQKIGSLLKLSTVHFPGFLLVILVSIYSFTGLFNLGEDFPPPLFSYYAGAALVPTLLAYGAIIILGILRNRRSGKKSDDLLMGKLFLSLSILMVSLITNSMQLPDYWGYSSLSFGELFIDESFFAQHVIAYPAAVFGFFNVIFLAAKFPWRFIVKRLATYSALALLGGSIVFAYFHYFIEPKYLWDYKNGELYRDVRTIWAKNRKLVDTGGERDVTDLEFYFWDRSEPLLLEDVGWLDSGNMIWSTRSGEQYRLGAWFGSRMLDFNKNSWNDFDRNWDIKLWLENIGIELHIGYKGLPLGFLETYPIISILEDPAMGTTFYWGVQQIDISQVAKIVNRDPSQKVFIRVAWGNLSDFSFSSGNNGSLIQDIIGGIRDGGYKDPIQAILIDDQGTNYFINDLEANLAYLVKYGMSEE